MSNELRGADVLVKAIERAGVSHLFTLSGNQIMPVFDACVDADLRLIHVRHEAAAVHMADAWGRLTGEPGVALVTAGPGIANTLSALYVALQAESPLVVVSGQSSPAQHGRGVFQEMPQAELAGHVTKASWTATDPARLGHDVARALRVSRSGRPGPVHLAVPFDVLQATVDWSRDLLPIADDFQPSFSLMDSHTAETIVAELDRAARPLIIAGPASRRGEPAELLAALEQQLSIPCLALDSPRSPSDPSYGAFADVLPEADVIVLIGKKLDFMLRFGAPPHVGRNCRFIHLDADVNCLEDTSRVLDDASRLIVADVADPVPVLERLLQTPPVPQSTRRDWLDAVRTAIQFRPPEWQRLSSPSDGPLHAVEVCRAVQSYLDEGEDSVFVSDGGEFGQWAQACLTAGRRIINGPSGSIGSALPFALAARLAFPDARIAATLGDGTFGFHAMEFDTAVRCQLPFIAVVGNDSGWNAEREIQLREYGPDRLIGCDLLPTRYDLVTTALGGHGENVQRPAELLPALRRAHDSRLPACLNVAVQPNAAPTIRRE